MTPFTQKKPGFATSLVAIVTALIVAACGGGGGGGGGGGTGTLRLALTDAPACGYDAVNITVLKVRVHQSSTAGDGDAGWSEIVLSPARRIDLLSLTNGVLVELGQTELSAGKYTQMRLVLAPNDNAMPMSNAIKPTGGTETAVELALDTPSATQSGLKLNVNITVETGKVADFVIDFDACKSVVRRGNSGRYNLKPVMAVIPRISAAGITGYVAAALGVSATTVSAQQNGVPVRSTRPDDSGRFVIAPLPAGNYDVVVSADGRATATVTGVPFSGTGNTVVSTDTARIDPPESTMRTISGAVSVTPKPEGIYALVVARKTYAGGPTVEVAGIPANGEDGKFSLSVPADAPFKAAYVSSAASPAFVKDGAAPTGQYTVVATVGADSKSTGVDVTTTGATGISFAFP